MTSPHAESLHSHVNTSEHDSLIHSNAGSSSKIMSKTRLEAFSDGVIAIIITVMVLDLKTPEKEDWSAAIGVAKYLLLYALSFLYVGIYWMNHHHLIHTTKGVNGVVLIANCHLLFWLSLLPFTTRWLGESELSMPAVISYGATLLCCAMAYTILSMVLLRLNGPQSELARAMGNDYKGKLSLFMYCLGIGLAFWTPIAGIVCFSLVACMWFLPDRRIESLK